MDGNGWIESADVIGLFRLERCREHEYGWLTVLSCARHHDEFDDVHGESLM
jgi:hypothetical protein